MTLPRALFPCLVKKNRAKFPAFHQVFFVLLSVICGVYTYHFLKSCQPSLWNSTAAFFQSPTAKYGHGKCRNWKIYCVKSVAFFQVVELVCCECTMVAFPTSAYPCFEITHSSSCEGISVMGNRIHAWLYLQITS